MSLLHAYSADGRPSIQASGAVEGLIRREEDGAVESPSLERPSHPSLRYSQFADTGSVITASTEAERQPKNSNNPASPCGCWGRLKASLYDA